MPTITELATELSTTYSVPQSRVELAVLAWLADRVDRTGSYLGFTTDHLLYRQARQCGCSICQTTLRGTGLSNAAAVVAREFFQAMADRTRKYPRR